MVVGYLIDVQDNAKLSASCYLSQKRKIKNFILSVQINALSVASVPGD